MFICQRFATMNRLHIMNEILNGVGLQEKIPEIHFFQTVHNYIDIGDNRYSDGIIRKGSVSAKKGEKLIIPLNMKDGSLICIGKGNPDWNCSAPHGAGRMYSRAAAKKAFSIDEFKKQMDGMSFLHIGLSFYLFPFSAAACEGGRRTILSMGSSGLTLAPGQRCAGITTLHLHRSNLRIPTG